MVSHREALELQVAAREVKKVQFESPRDRLFRLQADELELNAAERRGSLVRADSIEPRLRSAVVAAREVREETGIDAGAPGCRLRDWGLENVYAIYPQWQHRY